MKKVIFFIFMSFIVCSFVSAEDITITTYYPAPFGVYRDLTTETLTVLNNDEEVSMGGDAGNPSIELRHTAGGASTPYIDFSNDPGVDFDYRFILNGNNNFDITGGRTTFRNDDGTPATIRVGGVWYCLNY